MSAWVAAPRRPELAAEIDRQMLAGLDQLTALLERGVTERAFVVDTPRKSAFRILVLLDGTLVQISMRAEKTYGDVDSLAWETVEREVGLAPGALRDIS